MVYSVYIRSVILFFFSIYVVALAVFVPPSFGFNDMLDTSSNKVNEPTRRLEKATPQSKTHPHIKKPNSKSAVKKDPRREFLKNTTPEVAAQHTKKEKAELSSPKFTNLQQEFRVFGMPQNLNLDTLYKLNPQLWDEFRKSFPKVPSDIQPASIQPFFARFIQDYVLTAIYETHLPALSWYPEAKGFGWRDILNNPQYRDIMKSQQQANKGWFVSDVADWIQRSYIQSQESNTPLPWQPEETSSTQAGTMGAPPAPEKGESEKSISTTSVGATSSSGATSSALAKRSSPSDSPSKSLLDEIQRFNPKTLSPSPTKSREPTTLGATSNSSVDTTSSSGAITSPPAKPSSLSDSPSKSLLDEIQRFNPKTLSPSPTKSRKQTKLEATGNSSVDTTSSSRAISTPPAKPSSSSGSPPETFLDQIQRFNRETLSPSPTKSREQTKLEATGNSAPTIFDALAARIAKFSTGESTAGKDVEEDEWETSSETIDMTSNEAQPSLSGENREDTPRKLVSQPRLTNRDEAQLYSLLEREHAPEKVRLDDIELETQQRAAIDKFNGQLMRFDAVIEKYENELSILENPQLMEDEIQRLEQLNTEGSTSDKNANRLLSLKQYYADYNALRNKIEEELAILKSLKGVKLMRTNIDRKSSSPAKPSVEEEIEQMETQLREMKPVPNSSPYLVSVKERLNKERKKRADVVISHGNYNQNLENFKTLKALVVNDPLKEDEVEQLERVIRKYLANFLKEEIEARKPKTESSAAESLTQMLLKQRQRAGGIYDEGEESEESDSEDWLDE